MEDNLSKIHEAIKEDPTVFYEMYKGFYKEFTEELKEKHDSAKRMAAVMLSFYYSGKNELSEDELTKYSLDILGIIDYVEEHSN